MTNTLTHPTRTHVQLLRFMHQYLQQNNQLPGNAAIAAAFGWASPNAASEHLARMERLGLLCRNEAGNIMLSRSMRVRGYMTDAPIDVALRVAHILPDRPPTPLVIQNTDARLNAHITP